jgi:protein-tyrosine phosphatase
MLVTDLPLDLPGGLFRSPMPFSEFDPLGNCLVEFRKHSISTVVLLAEDRECRLVSRLDLRHFYAAQGFEVIYHPIPNGGVPVESELYKTIDATVALLRSGRNVVTHCHAGIGRTGLFAACLSQEVEDWSADEAIVWFHDHMPPGFWFPETFEQEEFMRGYRTRPRDPGTTS